MSDLKIGVFDSGHGGLTVFRQLLADFPEVSFFYLGDHGRAPYGNRQGVEILKFTQQSVDWLYAQGCDVVLLGCNTATAIAGRALQQEWLPLARAKYGRELRLLGIIAPTVEAVTQTPWHVKEPVFPQKYNRDTVGIFATTATVRSGVFEVEIAKRCPHIQVVSRACPDLVPMLEQGDAEGIILQAIDAHVAATVQDAVATTGRVPDWAILGCTHFPLVEHLFRRALPASTRVLSQPLAVSHSLRDYLERHYPHAVEAGVVGAPPLYYTTGLVARVRAVAFNLLREDVPFEEAVIAG